MNENLMNKIQLRTTSILSRLNQAPHDELKNDSAFSLASLHLKNQVFARDSKDSVLFARGISLNGNSPDWDKYQPYPMQNTNSFALFQSLGSHKIICEDNSGNDEATDALLLCYNLQ